MSTALSSSIPVALVSLFRRTESEDRVCQLRTLDYYLTGTCVSLALGFPDCDTCRWLAPDVFHRDGGQSAVKSQPSSGSSAAEATQAAAVACPTGSIRITRGKGGLTAPEKKALFPMAMPHAGSGTRVYYLGYTDEHTFAASTWLIVGDDKAVMVDVPRYNSSLAKEVEKLLASFGRSLDYIFLSHRDDVFAHDKWSARFPGAKRIIHAVDANERQKTLDCEMILELEPGERLTIGLSLEVISTPGHTSGCLCLIDLESESLFTGDTLAYSATAGGLTGFPRYNNGNWRQQLETIEKLAEEPFLHIFPGHGRMYSFANSSERREEIVSAVREMGIIRA